MSRLILLILWCVFNIFESACRALDALPARCWRYVWRLGASTVFIKSDGFSLAGASDSQSGANVVLRGGPSKYYYVIRNTCKRNSAGCPVRRAGGSRHRGGFKYAAHTPAAVCGGRPEQNVAAVVPESVSAHVCLWVSV